MKLYDRVAAIAAFNDDGLLLFGLRGDGKGWCLPGGHFNEGESPLDAAKRELAEETGLIAVDLEYLGSALGNSPGISVWAFKCLVAGEPDASADPDGEFVEFRWVRPGEIPADICDNLRDHPNVVLDLLGCSYGESLSKGSMQRRHKFDPHWEINEEQRGKFLGWQSGAIGPSARENLPKMQGAPRVRALQRLSGRTKTRMNTRGEREFLLHRGMDTAEFNETHDPEKNAITHAIRSSWTPHRDVAARFAEEYGEMQPDMSKVVSAWVPESRIATVPAQLGRFTLANPEQVARGKIPHQERGKNSYSNEHEIVLEPGQSSHATEEDLKPDPVHARIAEGARIKRFYPQLDPSKAKAMLQTRYGTYQKSLAPEPFDMHQHQLVDRIQDSLSDDLRRTPWKGSSNCLAGHCYAASEALWHLLGGSESGYVPQQVHHEGSSHWYLRHAQSGHIIDPTADQFHDPVPYDQGKGKGFLTAQPSHRARIIMERAMNPLMKAEATQHWHSQDGLRIPVAGTPARRTWNQKFVQGIAQAFAGGDHNRLAPTKLDVNEPGLSSNMAVNKARLRLYRRMLSAGEKLPPVVVQRSGQGWRLIDGNHRVEAARALGHTHVPALELKPQP